MLENPTALPRAFLAERAEVVPDDEALIARLRDPAVDLRETVLLSAPPPEGFAAPAPIDSASTARVALERFSPREIVWRVETDRPRLLVASEVYYPAGWKAYIRQEEVPILRADFLLRAVPVPAGSHLVSMRFEPEVHERSVLLSALAALLVYGGLLLLGGWGWYRRGHPEG